MEFDNAKIEEDSSDRSGGRLRRLMCPYILKYDAGTERRRRRRCPARPRAVTGKSVTKGDRRIGSDDVRGTRAGFWGRAYRRTLRGR
jgi:hypothetical protein